MDGLIVVVVGVVVEVVLVVVVVPGTRGAFGMTATLLRSLTAVPINATTLHRENLAGVVVSVVSV